MKPQSDSKTISWQIKLLYDGECPLCLREVRFLQHKDSGQGKVVFVDIADDNYSPDEHGGVTYEAAMGRIHAILPDGKVVKNVEVFRRFYEVLGIGWVYAATQLPLIGAIANQIYFLWAELRLKLTGRPDLATLVALRQKRLMAKALEGCPSVEGNLRTPVNCQLGIDH